MKKLTHVIAAVLGLTLALASCAPPGASDTPGGTDTGEASTGESSTDAAGPATINVVDSAGNLQLSQPIFDNFLADHPELVKEFTFQKVNTPDLVGKLQAQQKAGRVDIDLVLTGSDGMAAGLAQDVWYDLLDKHADELPEVDGLYVEGADKFQSLAEDKGLTFVFYPGGPLLEYNPEKVTDVPTTAEELLQWTAENPNRFFYPRPANSGVGRAFLMGLPYILADDDPKDPVNGWDKTWQYLKDLDKNIDYYPSGTAQIMTELAQGNRWMIPTTTGWDINPRAIGQVPKEIEIAAFDEFTWVGDGHFLAIPEGVSEEKIDVLIEFINYALSPEQQAYTYDSGYLYPGPAVNGVTLDMAPQESQDLLNEFGRAEYDTLIAEHPLEIPLEPDAMLQAFDIWDREIGASKVQEN